MNPGRFGSLTLVPVSAINLAAELCSAFPLTEPIVHLYNKWMLKPNQQQPPRWQKLPRALLSSSPLWSPSSRASISLPRFTQMFFLFFFFRLVFCVWRTKTGVVQWLMGDAAQGHCDIWQWYFHQPSKCLVSTNPSPGNQMKDWAETEWRRGEWMKIWHDACLIDHGQRDPQEYNIAAASRWRPGRDGDRLCGLWQNTKCL